MFCSPFGQKQSLASLLTHEDLIIMAIQAKSKAKRVKSVFRKTDAGEALPAQISISVVERNEKVPAVFAKGEDIHPSFHEISNALAHQTLMASSDGKATSSRSMGSAAGGVPLYKTLDGKTTLVGAIAVAGDHPDQNEAIALAASRGFEAPETIKETGFALSLPVEELEVEEFYPDLTGLAPVSPLEKLGKSFPTLGGSPDVQSTPLTGSTLRLPPIVPTASAGTDSVSTLSASMTSPLPPISTEFSRKRNVNSLPPSSPLPPVSGQSFSRKKTVKALPPSSPLPPISGTSTLPPLSASLKTSPLPPMSGSPSPVLAASRLPPMASTPPQPIS